MQTSEFEYYLLCELISMPDRVLAQQIELAVWARSPIPNEPILQKFLALLEQSSGSDEFYDRAREYVAALPIDWSVSIRDAEGREYANHAFGKGFANFEGFGWDTVSVTRSDKRG